MDNISPVADWSVEKRELLTLLLEEEGMEYNVFPLSFSQQRLWFLDALENDSSPYHIPLVARLSGRLNFLALRDSVNEIGRRHEALRTRFSVVAGAPVQVVDSEFTGEPALVEAPPRSDETSVVNIVAAEIRRPFDLSRGPLFRAIVLRLNPTEHLFIIVVHHIVSDDWSTGVMVRELAALYRAFVAGLPSPLLPLPIQYADFAQWQRETVTSEYLENQLAFWRGRLGGELPIIELPADRPRPAVPSFRGASIEFWTTGQTVSSIESVSRRQGATGFMTLLAAFQILLYRYSGQPDVLVGAPIANRRRAETESLIGFFVNTLVLRADLTGDPTFRELLGRVKEVTLDAYANQDLPFEMLVSELRPDRDLTRNPIFQVMLAHHNAPITSVELPGLTLTVEDQQTTSARFDLELHVWEEPQRLKWLLVYNTDLFYESSIRRLVANFQTLLNGIAADPDRRISCLPILSEEEERQLLIEFNRTAYDQPRDLCVHHSVSRHAEMAPDRIALVWEDNEISYRELSVRANRLAHSLRRSGIGPDRAVGVFMERSVEMLISVLGVLKAGGAYLPLDPAYPEERIRFMLDDAGVDVVLTQQSLAARLPDSVVQVRCLDSDLNAIADYNEEEPAVKGYPSAIAYIIYTSGSTGAPKGVAMPHEPLVNLIDWQTRRSGGTEAPRTLQFTSLSFDVSFQEIFSTWRAGGALILLSERDRRDPARLWATLTEQQIERLFLPFVALQHLAEAAAREAAAREAAAREAAAREAAARDEPISLREVITAGEQLKVTGPIRSLFAKMRRCTLDNQYGPAEAHVVSSHALDKADVETWPELPPIGRPIANTELHILDRHMQMAPIGVRGELYIGGDCLARGYLGRADTTAEKFVPDPSEKRKGARLYRTGDMARWSANGSIEFLGRNDDQIKIRGHRVEIGEVESALRNHPQINEVAVVVKETESGARRLAAYVRLNQPADLTANDLRVFLRHTLPDYMIPQAIVQIEKFPLTPSGKIDKRSLPEIESMESAVEGNPGSARTPVEDILAGVWMGLLDAQAIARDDNFFTLGGHSLLATQLVSRIRDAFNVELPIRAIFEESTLERMARAIESEMRSGRVRPLPPISTVARGNPAPLSFSQQRLWFIHQLGMGAAIYTLPMALRLKGKLNHVALEMSLSEVIRRHETLRTIITTTAGAPSQIVEERRNTTLRVIDLSGQSQGEAEATAFALARCEARRAFDLEHEPLIRSALVKVGPEDHLLLCTIHHIICDGWSIDILVREITALYEAFSRGASSPLADLPVQYTDYVQCRREWLKGQVLEAQLSYWRRQLAATPPLALPTDRARPAIRSWDGGIKKLAIDAALTSELKSCARREGVTLYMLLLAAFEVLLYRYSRQQEIAVGSPISGRNQSEIEGLIGLFINVLVIKSSVVGGQSFRGFLREVRRTVLDAYSHQDVPFETLVDELAPERDLSQSPLFQVMFALHSAPGQRLALQGVEVSALDVDNGTSRFDLTLELIDHGATIEGWFEYQADLFDEPRMERMAAHYRNLLRSLGADLEQPLGELSLLTESEGDLLIRQWNGASQSYEADKCVHQFFEEWADRNPGQIAVVFRNEQISYGELNRRANHLAHQLMALGVGPGKFVGVSIDRSIELIVGLLGILKAGAAYAPIDRSYPPERQSFILADAGVCALIAENEPSLDLPPIDADIVKIGSEWGDDKGQVYANPHSEVLPDHPAYVIYTSGSTGAPKGVLVAHRNVANFFAGMDQRIGDGPSGTWLAVTSVSFDISVLELLWTLSRGFKVILHEGPNRRPEAPTRPVKSNKKIDFSLFYFADSERENPNAKYKLLLDGARFADEHGFAAVWTPERHFHAFGGLYPNPAVVGAALASITNHIGIRAGSVVLPLHHPARVAEEWSVVDNLSGGRVGVSFASGWQIDDFVLAPDNYSRRAQLMYEQIHIVQKLWRGEPVNLSGVDGRDTEIRLLPRPLQPNLPIWITAAGNIETFRSAGRIGAGLLTHLLGQDVDHLSEKIAAYREARGVAGFDPDSGSVALMLHAFVGRDLDLVREKVRDPFCRYLMQAVSLAQNLARSLGEEIDFMSLEPAEQEAFLRRSFDRYFERAGLMGTPDSCLPMVERLKEIGVNEIACLIDFGVDHDSVISSLRYLNLIKELANGRTVGRRSGGDAEADESDYSILSQIRRHGVTHLQCTPSLASTFLMDERAPEALGSIREVMVGGEVLPPALGERLREITTGRVQNMYGPTETTVWSTTYTLNEVTGAIPIGRPIANTQSYLMDRSMQNVPIGVPGDLYLGGAGVVHGYLRRPELTAERFIPNPFASAPGDRLYFTGDVARYSEGGDLEFLGRGDNQVKLRGYRIELGEIEATLGGLPSVREAAVTARKDETGADCLVAYVVPKTPPLKRSAKADPNILNGFRRMTLPGGLMVAHHDSSQTGAIYREIFEQRIYAKSGIVFNDGDCIFDVGANIGLFTLFANQMCRNPVVYAFEPIPRTFDLLRINVALYGLSVNLFDMGLADFDGTEKFTFYPEAAGLSGRSVYSARDEETTRNIVSNWLERVAPEQSQVQDRAEIERAVEEGMRREIYDCRVTTLSRVMRDHQVDRIDLLKIDVEGGESDVLSGIDDADWPKIKQVVMEIDTEEALDQIRTKLEKQAFNLKIEQTAVVEEGKSYIYMLYATRREYAGESIDLNETAVVGIPGANLSVPQLRGYLKERLPDYMVPSAFVFLDALPLTPNGKVDRRALPSPEILRASVGNPYTAPQNEIEEIIAGIWQEVLKVDRVGITDNFFELGGNSLLLVTLHSRLKSAFNRDFSIVEVFRRATVSDQAGYLSGVDQEPSIAKDLRNRADSQTQATITQARLNRERTEKFRRGRKGAAKVEGD